MWPLSHVIAVWRFGRDVIDARSLRGVKLRCRDARARDGMEPMITYLRRGRVLRGSMGALAVICGLSLGACASRAGHGAPTRGASGVIGVNSFLWRATLDTLAFMPLQSADPYGGVVNTDWYIDPQRPTERFKATVYILDTRLRADGLNVAVFKEVSNGQGGWTPSPTSDQTATDIENAILTRARELRLSNLRG